MNWIDGDKRRYVDWPAKIDILGEAKTVTALWAELAQRYQRTQEQHALYVDLIQRYRRNQKQRKVTRAGLDRLGEAAGADGAGPPADPGHLRVADEVA